MWNKKSMAFSFLVLCLVYATTLECTVGCFHHILFFSPNKRFWCNKRAYSQVSNKRIGSIKRAGRILFLTFIASEQGAIFLLLHKSL